MVHEAAMESTTVWVVGAVLGAILSTLGFLIRNAFTDVKDMLREMGADLKAVRVDQNTDRTDLRMLERDMQTVRRDLEEMRTRVKELSEGIIR